MPSRLLYKSTLLFAKLQKERRFILFLPNFLFPHYLLPSSCNYDSLDLQSRDPLSISGEQRDSTLAPWRRCGNWNSRLKLLRWKSSANRAQIRYCYCHRLIRKEANLFGFLYISFSHKIECFFFYRNVKVHFRHVLQRQWFSTGGYYRKRLVTHAVSIDIIILFLNTGGCRFSFNLMLFDFSKPTCIALKPDLSCITVVVI